MASGRKQQETHSVAKWLNNIIDSPTVGFFSLAFGLMGLNIVFCKFFVIVAAIGLVFIAICVAQRFPDILRRTQIIEQQTTLIPDCEGMGKTITETTKQLISQMDSSVEIGYRNVAAGFWQAIFDVSRPFLVIQSTHPKIRSYRIYIGAIDYGRNLQVVWYVVRKPGCEPESNVPAPIRSTRSAALANWSGNYATARKVGSGLNPFDEMYLQAYITNAHNCLKEAIENLIDGRDSNGEPKGFLGIS